MAKVEDGSIESFRPQQRNLNRHSQRGMGALEASMRKHGYVAPMTAAASGEIIDGSARLETVANVFDDDVLIVHHDGTRPVVMVRDDIKDATTNEARAISALANRVAEINLEWDAAELLADLQSGVDFGDVFKQDELDALLAGLVAPEPVNDTPPDVSKADELQQKWQTQTGQIWQLGKHRLAVGDCRNMATVKRLMQGEVAALAWFDPPFGIDLKPQRGLNEQIENDGNDEARRLWAAFLPLLHANMADDSHVFLCQGWTEFDWTLPLIREYFTLKSKVVWNKNVWGIGYYTRPKHEDIIYCWKGQPATIDEPVADVWDIAREHAPEHAAEKPPELSAMAIQNFSHSGDIVIDWFSGLGGSTIACEQLSRQCRAIELDAGYVAITLQRFQDATGIEPILLD